MLSQHLKKFENDLTEKEQSKTLFGGLLKRNYKTGLKMFYDAGIPFKFSSHGRKIEFILREGDVEMLNFLFELKLSPEEVWNSDSVKACLLTHAIRLRPKNERGNFLNILSK